MSCSSVEISFASTHQPMEILTKSVDALKIMCIRLLVPRRGTVFRFTSCNTLVKRISNWSRRPNCTILSTMTYSFYNSNLTWCHVSVWWSIDQTLTFDNNANDTVGARDFHDRVASVTDIWRGQHPRLQYNSKRIDYCNAASRPVDASSVQPAWTTPAHLPGHPFGASIDSDKFIPELHGGQHWRDQLHGGCRASRGKSAGAGKSDGN